MVPHHLLDQASSIIGLDKDRDRGRRHANERKDGRLVRGDSDPDFHPQPSLGTVFQRMGIDNREPI
jgi:hypothetical protein